MKTKQLTNNQLDFLLNNFFHNEKYPGWRNIATKLLQDGKCIVAGQNSIWQGGVGNFIKVEDAEDTIECSLYTFDLEYFLKSEFYKDVSIKFKVILSDKISKLNDELTEICNI